MTQSEKHMDLLTRKDMDTLLAEREGPCLSIYMPTHRYGAEVLQGPIRLKNLMRQAEEKLAAIGVKSLRIGEILSPAQVLLLDLRFWQLQVGGLALFAAPGVFLTYRLPLDFNETVVACQHRFHLKPLLPVLGDDGTFHVLAISKGGPRLMQGTHYTIDELELKDVPKNLAEFMRFDDFEISRQQHSGAQPGANSGAGGIVHGNGEVTEDPKLKDRVLDYFRQVDGAVRDLLAGDHSPLVLAGIEYIRAIYGEANRYEALHAEGIEGNPEEMSMEDLHRRAWAMVAPIFQQRRRETLERYLHLAGTRDKRAANRIETVVPAAYYQRAEALFVPTDRQFWGAFDSASNKVRVRQRGKIGDEDLLNFAVIHTLRNHGAVYSLTAEEMPNGAPMAAILRY